MAFKLDKKIKKGEIVVVTIPSSGYKTKELEVVDYCTKMYVHICYVNLTQSHKALEEMFHKKHYEEKILLIDSICKESHSEKGQCVHIGSPNALTDLSRAVSKTLKSGFFPLLLFDSLSSLIVYNKSEVVTRFTHDLFGKLRKSGVLGIFTVQKSTENNLTADIEMFADHIIELK